MKKLFTAEQFTATKFDSAEDKAKFANHFVRFVESGFKETLFQKWFYRQLSNTFGHIAHFNQSGFYDVQCSTLSARLGFLEQAMQWHCYGTPDHTFCDVERALAHWIGDNDLICKYRNAVANVKELIERSELARLKAKYEKESAS